MHVLGTRLTKLPERVKLGRVLGKPSHAWELGLLNEGSMR